MILDTHVRTFRTIYIANTGVFVGLQSYHKDGALETIMIVIKSSVPHITVVRAHTFTHRFRADRFHFAYPEAPRAEKHSL